MTLINKAREFARAKHITQIRKYTFEPYFVHLEEVAGLVERAGLSETAIAAAWLHDAIEDQDVKIEEIITEFGAHVAYLVFDLTDVPASKGLNRDTRKKMDVSRLSLAMPDAQGIKCADLISNTSTIVKYDPGFARQYLPEKRAVLGVLTRAPDSLKQQAWASLQQAEEDLGLVGDRAIIRR